MMLYCYKYRTAFRIIPMQSPVKNDPIGNILEGLTVYIYADLKPFQNFGKKKFYGR